jgi:hypothetical protein
VLAAFACALAAGGAAPAVALVGGSPVSASSAPWTALVQYPVSGGGTDDCTGAIIAPSLVVTSAYCLYTQSGAVEPITGLSVIAGVSNYVTPASGDAEQTRAVDYVRIHPGFSFANGSVQPNDVALLTLTTPFDLTGSDVQAAALPAAGASFPANAAASVASFGASSSGGTPSGQLASIGVTVDPQGECGQPADEQFEDANAVELCAAGPSVTSCDGDGGAGLVTTGGTPTLIGIVNGSVGNCTPGGQIIFAYTGAAEIRDFLQGNDSPPEAPATSRNDPTSIFWYGLLIPGNTLDCSTAGWGGSVQTVYSFINSSTGQVLQSGARGTYVIPPGAVGDQVECVSAVTNAGGTTLARTVPASAIKAAGTVPHGCKITVKATLRSGKATHIEFVNDIAQPVKLYWLNDLGKRVLYATIPPGRSVEQQTYLGNPWVLTDASGGCVGYVLPPKARYVVG